MSAPPTAPPEARSAARAALRARLSRPLPLALGLLAVAALGGTLAAALAWLWPAGVWLWPLATAIVAAAAYGWGRGGRVRVNPVPAPASPVDEPGSDDAILRDARTGMFHRAAFLALAERDWQRAGRYGGAVGLVLVEVDRLRPMTDRAGPSVADALLAGLGRKVFASLRAADLLARFDAAQLAIFLPQADPTGALDVAERIREQVEALALEGLPEGAKFSASLGVSVLRPLHQPLSSLVGDAQRALAAARQAGGNCVRMMPADAAAALGGPGSWVGDDSRPARGKDA